MSLSAIKQAFYNKAPVIFLKSMADQGITFIIENGSITDIEVEHQQEIFNHAHPETFVNCPAGTAKSFAIKL